MERDLMKNKIRTALRIAVYYKHSNICLGAFGCGPKFNNPTREVATLWKEVLYDDEEFRGHFTNVIFAIKNYTTRHEGNTDKSSKSDLEIFREVFDPAKLADANFRPSDMCNYDPELNRKVFDPAELFEANYRSADTCNYCPERERGL